MQRQLTNEAKAILTNEPSLFADVCKLLNVRVLSLPTLIKRNSSRLTNHDVVLRIAEAMNKQPDDILEQIPEPTDA
jgi:hypothetical protein